MISANRHSLPWLAFGALALPLVLWLYSFGWSGAFYYDDHAPLAGLARVEDWLSAANFVFSSTAGPLGRPISMASFLLHASTWPNANAHLFAVNTLIHAINGTLVAALTLTLLQLSRGPHHHNAWIAVATAALWLVMPIQVSTSLIAIQRMASLSALFVFAGLLLYLRGLAIQAYRPRRALFLQATGLGLFTLLAILCKENGALLPLLAGVIEFTVLAQCPAIARWRNLRRLALAGAFAAMLAYLGSVVFDAAASYQHRSFTLSERLLTEPVILWRYLNLAFLPASLAYTPFHDDVAPFQTLLGTPVVATAIAAWLAALAGAVIWRRRFPVVALAILWFAVAHLLESTVIALELYFEHRNYVALFGPCLLFAWGVASLARRYPRLAPTGFAAYLALMAGVLFQVTSLWGDRLLAAEIWAMQEPASARASAHLASIYNNEMKAPDVALRILDNNARACPECTSTRAQALALACSIERPEHFRDRYAAFRAALAGPGSASGLVESLSVLHGAIREKQCTLVAMEDLREIYLELLDKPRYAARLGVRTNLHVSLFDAYRTEGRIAEAKDHLLTAWALSRDHGIAYQWVEFLIEQGEFETARRFAEEEMCRTPAHNPIMARVEAERCAAVTAQVRDAARSLASRKVRVP